MHVYTGVAHRMTYDQKFNLSYCPLFQCIENTKKRRASAHFYSTTWADVADKTQFRNNGSWEGVQPRTGPSNNNRRKTRSASSQLGRGELL